MHGTQCRSYVRTSAVSGNEKELWLILMGFCMPVVLRKVQLIVVVLAVEGWEAHARPS